MLLSSIAFLNLLFYLNLYPPCQPDILSPYGCTNLNWDPGNQEVFEETIWMTIFSNGCLAILTYIMIGLGSLSYSLCHPGGLCIIHHIGQDLDM